ncbi:MAG: hypothetical protein U0790_11045 [Isosphaeraceae bacterium]
MSVPVGGVQPARWWAYCIAGGVGGGLFGLISGPISMLAFMSLDHYLHGTVFLGLELLAAPIFGVIMGTVEGVGFGAIWAYMAARPRRLTLAGLMLVVAVSGPSLAFSIAFPPIALIALINAMILLPVAIMIKVAVDQHQDERRRSIRRTPRRTSPRQHEDGIEDLNVRFTDW